MARSSDATFPKSLYGDKAFQFRLIRRVMWMTAFFIVQSTIVLGVFYYTFLGKLVAGNAPLLFASEDMGGLGDAIPSMGNVIGSWLAVMLVINAIVTGSIAVYVLRKLGNPILAIKRALNEIGDGNLEVRLRTGDSLEFNELCVALNRTLDQVHSKISEARELTKVMDRLDDQPSPDDQEVRQALQDCHNVLTYFDCTERAKNESFAAKDDSETRRINGQ
ncbi:MAG: HAMP domain-containing protein [Granulosicoccus sp.]